MQRIGLRLAAQSGNLEFFQRLESNAINLRFASFMATLKTLSLASLPIALCAWDLSSRSGPSALALIAKMQRSSVGFDGLKPHQTFGNRVGLKAQHPCIFVDEIIRIG